uniref:Uncharacterized protein n=1 Tax=Arundo donax TaxID=35708 RepID=A0A0A9EIU6_ARUDO
MQTETSWHFQHPRLIKQVNIVRSLSFIFGLCLHIYPFSNYLF